MQLTSIQHHSYHINIQNHIAFDKYRISCIHIKFYSNINYIDLLGHSFFFKFWLEDHIPPMDAIISGWPLPGTINLKFSKVLFGFFSLNIPAMKQNYNNYTLKTLITKICVHCRNNSGYSE